jgi:hypothetical protein
LKRILIPLGVFLLFLVVIRFIVTPLAAQREERRDQGLPALAAIPSECDRFVQRRNSHRRFPPKLWPEGKGAALRTAESMGMPRESIEEVLGLDPFSSGEWLFAAAIDQDWWLLGPLSRLERAQSESHVLKEEDGIWRTGSYACRRHGRFFLLASSEEALAKAQGGWLPAQPMGFELGDLMVSGDLLIYMKQDQGAVLGALRELKGHVLAEGRAWGGASWEQLLTLANPLPRPEGKVDASLPYLRRSAPWDPAGNALSPAAIFGDENSTLRVWSDGEFAAYAQVIAPSGISTSP